MNQQTIPLSQLQCYLAFGLTGQANIHYNAITSKWINCDLNGIIEDSVVVRCKDIHGVLWPGKETISINHFRPAVIPLTSLTDQQWVEVFKAGWETFSSNTGFYVNHDNGIHTVKYHEWTNRIEVRYHPLFKSFYVSGSSTFNSLSAFQKLFELHADVWGWVEAGLAEDKLTFNK